MNEFDPFAAEWISYAKSPQYTLVEKCLKLSQILEFPDLDITEYVKKLRSFEHGLHDHISDVKNPIYLVSMLTSTCLTFWSLKEIVMITIIQETIFLT